MANKLVNVVVNLLPKTTAIQAAVRQMTGADKQPSGAALSSALGGGTAQQHKNASILQVREGFTKQRQELELMETKGSAAFIQRQASLNIQLDQKRKEYEKALGAEELSQRYGKAGAGAMQFGKSLGTIGLVAGGAVGAVVGLGTAIVGLAAKANPMQWERLSSAMDDLMAAVGRSPLIQKAANAFTGGIRRLADYAAGDTGSLFASQDVKELDKEIAQRKALIDTPMKRFFHPAPNHEENIIRQLEDRREKSLKGLLPSSQGLGDFRPSTMRSLEGVGQSWRMNSSMIGEDSAEVKQANLLEQIVAEFKALDEKIPGEMLVYGSGQQRAIDGFDGG